MSYSRSIAHRDRHYHLHFIPPIKSIKSANVDGCNTDIDFCFLAVFLGSGITAFSKPSFAASFKRVSEWATCRNSDESAISPKNTVRCGAGLPVRDEIKAAATSYVQDKLLFFDHHAYNSWLRMPKSYLNFMLLCDTETDAKNVHERKEEKIISWKK